MGLCRSIGNACRSDEFACLFNLCIEEEGELKIHPTDAKYIASRGCKTWKEIMAIVEERALERAVGALMD